ncbi:aspartate/glutamate racemase family protein [Henriciella litoralis]|uniref:aspartate/glutamate racemase family protein n=1 Tax=Henriciella litoralis TaxID=568102 RepID=UPI000A02B627|nr:amino acid racemase [Henriciella litoralis]
MSLVGLIGGVSPEATKIYYELLNGHARDRLGGQHSARCLFYMLDYGVMIGHYHDENWEAFKAEVIKGALSLKAAGAEAIAITSGTTHVAAEAVAQETGLPVIHMLDSLSDAMIAKGVASPLLLGTPWVMSGDFFAPALAQRFPGTPVIASAEDCDLVGRVIFEELVEGVVKDSSRDELTAMITRYADEGADGVILGCTELCMILSDGDGPLPVFSTTHIHADAVNDWMTGKARA